MTTRKRKEYSKKGKINSIYPFIIAPSALAIIIFIFLYLNISKSTISISPPVYEEIYSVPSALKEKIRQIDYKIYESLYQSGAQERDVYYLKVEPKQQNGYTYDFSLLSIRCNDAEFALNLQKKLAHDLTSLDSAITFRNEEPAEGRIICHIFANGSYTHKIIIRFDEYQFPAKDSRPKIAIIIDDLGYDLNLASDFLQLDLPITYSVLPFAPFTRRIAQEAKKEGCEVILHLPMEPKNYPSVNPGPGTLLLSMDGEKIRHILGENLREIENVQGVNNHMGSAFTENREKMLVVLEELKRRNLFYIDSLTTNRTVGYTLSKELGLPVARRSVFLDNDLEPKSIAIQIERLMSMARHTDFAVGIGHPHETTLKLLKDYYPMIKNEFQVVFVSELTG